MASFPYDITVMAGGTIKVDGATVKMGAGARIILRGYFGTAGPPPNASAAAVFEARNQSLVTVITPGTYWSGIETMRGATSSPGPASPNASRIFIENSTIENAETAIRNFDKDFAASTTNGGTVAANLTLFRNNKRALWFHNEVNAGAIVDPNTQTSGMNWNALFQYCSFTHTNNFNPSPYPPDMVYLDNCKNITFLSCTFTGSAVNPLNTSGIMGVNASVKVQQFNDLMPRCVFSNLNTGIYLVNSLQTDRVSLVRNADFYCLYGINMSGCFMPWVLGCNFQVDNSPSYFGIFLRNSTGYRIEGNTLCGHPAGGPGIVVKNSGTAYNEIYRNKTKPFPLGLLLGVQSIGRNRNTAATTGLKILCNNLLGTWNGYEISVMQDVINSGSDGIARLQYLPAGLSNLYDYSAGNKFNYTSAPTAGYNYPNYFIGPNTNTIADFQYGCTGIGAPEVPVNRNFTNIIGTQANTCPVHNNGAPPAPFPFSQFITALSVIESQITLIEAKPGRTYNDTALLDGLLTAHALLIDRAVGQYQYRKDTDTANYIDSIALVYAKVTKGYQYKLYQASAYRELARWDDAFKVLNKIPEKYTLSEEEQAEVAHTLVLYQALQWLEGPGATWNNLPVQFRDLISACAAADRTQAGAIARALLAQYEGAIFPPEFIPPSPDYAAASRLMAAKREWNIYPNPVSGQLWVDCATGNALLVLSDISGRVVLRHVLNGGKDMINISHLPAGVYVAGLSTEHRIVYTQKIIKK
ncbi:T9SS type A sorting domain-containing protein [Taibaiella chishuiensis]|uniref:T9SS type A sorting domain-containing protein n=1 Tax=Taibaiella chishuiensis TaxID=1434707 RepID=UPI0015E67860|nr:T9SS type A sorting domain-containing protein [Taibaiella chishuiensis]